MLYSWLEQLEFEVSPSQFDPERLPFLEKVFDIPVARIYHVR